MAKMIQVPYDYTITLPIATAQAVQKNNDNPVSLKALGLLVNLLSYPSTWELHKTELYKRFEKDGEKSVKAAWNDLIDANYIIEFRYRVGKKYEYVYYFRKVPFTNEEKTEILTNAEKEYGEIWGLQNGDPKMETSKGRDNKKPLLNKKPLSKLEEEEKVSPSDLVSFLISKEITLDNALKFETRLLEEGLEGFTYEQVLDAIEWSLHRFLEGKCDEPYIYAVGRLQRVLDGKVKNIANKPMNITIKKRPVRTEKLPDWFDQEENKEKLPAEPEQTQEEKKQEIEDMLKKLRA